MSAQTETLATYLSERAEEARERAQFYASQGLNRASHDAAAEAFDTAALVLMQNAVKIAQAQAMAHRLATYAGIEQDPAVRWQLAYLGDPDAFAPDLRTPSPHREPALYRLRAWAQGLGETASAVLRAYG